MVKKNLDQELALLKYVVLETRIHLVMLLLKDINESVQ